MGIDLDLDPEVNVGILFGPGAEPKLRMLGDVGPLDVQADVGGDLP